MAVTEPNPIRGIWYAATSGSLPEAPCYGCRRGMRRAFVMNDGEIDYHHLVRDGVTIDCVGTSWLIDRWFDENPNLETDQKHELAMGGGTTCADEG